MQLEGAIRAVQMLSSDIANLTTNLALTRGQLEQAAEVLKEINVATWGDHPDEGGSEHFIQLPIGQYHVVLRLIDALS